MTARAYIKPDMFGRGVEIFLLPREGQVVLWETDAFGYPIFAEVDERATPPANAGLRLPDSLARPLYEALADHFGHSGHDIRALRKDYEAERRRVDQFIEHVTTHDHEARMRRGGQ